MMRKIEGDAVSLPRDDVNEAYARQLDRGVGKPLRIVSSPEEIAEGLPDGWGSFFSEDASLRVSSALDLWLDLLSHMPLMKQLFETRLLDVRPIRVGDREAGLAYAIASHESESILILVGYDPRFYGGNKPRLWDSVPAPLRNFSQNVHPSVGTAMLPVGSLPLFPESMDILDEDYDWSIVEAQEYLDSGFSVPLNQIMMVQETGGGGYVCVSPSLPGRGIFWRSDAPPVVEDFWTLYDLTALSICA